MFTVSETLQNAPVLNSNNISKSNNMKYLLSAYYVAVTVLNFNLMNIYSNLMGQIQL